MTIIDECLQEDRGQQKGWAKKIQKEMERKILTLSKNLLKKDQRKKYVIIF